MKKHCGMSLLETMVTISIAAILVAVGTPGMLELIRNSRQSAHVSDIVAYLNYARSEAIKKGCRVTVCPSGNGASCLGSGKWESGWIAFHDANGNGAVDMAETILHRHDKISDGSTLRGSQHHITYQSGGFSILKNDTLNLCDARGVAKSRSVIISNQGRVRVAPVAPVCP